ncbi:RDD family protein [Actinomadura sp. WAC 06369]|uniref:RDD family protein n=1 Tax=Actinomadura sp. WAC 06369 TaxID=2203193 RepID=UPI000F77CC41|nr:RDD family protein [Actinomadura sp. WAC 06369]RSN66248.1 RDD family protein [Actinomadura sp. WAC 06369]
METSQPAPAEPSGTAAVRLLAEPGQRLLARIVDTLVVGLPVMLVLREALPHGALDLVAPPAVAGCLLVYEAVQLALWGRTPGKRFAGIEVVRAEDVRAEAVLDRPDEDAPPPDARAGVEHGERGRADDPARLGALRGALRAAVYAVPIVARPVPVAGLLASVFWVANAGLLFEGRSRQALHDRLAGTVVVKSPGARSTTF